jgi:hypothetical protein
VTEVIASRAHGAQGGRIMKAVVVLLAVLVATPLFAHCDWINGPVVGDARAALKAGDLAPVLKWIPAAKEQEIRSAFAQTAKVRAQGAEARELADRWFFETVVRVHRESEGAAYHGLRGEDYKPEEGIVVAEAALESGSLESVEKGLSAAVKAGLHERFEHARHAKEHAGHNAEAGREYVHAYAEFLHYVQGLHDAAKKAGHHEE